MDDRSLRLIAANALSLHERLTTDVVADPTARPELVDARVRSWRETVAGDDAEAFRRRLAWDGLDEDSARDAVRPVQLRAGAPLPGWTRIFAEVLRRPYPASRQEPCLRESSQVPFEDVLLPFVAWARTECEQRAGASYRLFAADAHASLERQLLEWLSARAARALLLELTIDQAADMSPLEQLFGVEPSREPYEAFVERLLTEGLVGFFGEYCVLAGVLSLTAELWVAATVELIQRFAADTELIGARFGIAPTEPVVDVTSALSDPHRGLRSVATLAFESGERVVYKPRSLALELAWNDLLAWLGECGAPVDLRTFRVLHRGDYGWAEYVEHQPCADEEEVRRYFSRSGALLAIVYVLCGTDCHADNLVSAGEHPVLVDVETLLAPQPNEPRAGADAANLARRRLMGSVLATHLLPVWSRTLHGEVFDGSGFGMDPEQEGALTRQYWLDVNTSRMRPARGEVATTQRRAVTLQGEPLHVYEYEDELVEGFTTTYRFLAGERDALLASGSPFEQLRHADVRFVHRSTSLYSVVLDRLRNAELLRDGADRSIEIEQLAVAALSGAKADARTGWVDIWNAEREAIQRGDVPYFAARAGDTSLLLDDGREIPAWFARSGHDCTVDRVRSLNEPDLALQTDLIHSALRARRPTPEFRPRSTKRAGTPPRPPVSRDPWLPAAVAIARIVAQGAIVGDDGSVAWLQPAWTRDLMLVDKRRDLGVVAYDLYEGVVGVALFLAAVERATEEGTFLPLALGAVRSLLVDLKERPDDLARQLGIGGVSGLGSVVYGLVSMNRLLGDRMLLEGALQAARLITVGRIAADNALDVAVGAAGALLGLLALHEATDDATALAGAVACGQRIMAALEPASPHVRAVRTLNGRFLTGFAHGAAGMAYALCRLHGVTRDDALLGAAHELVAFERSTYSVDRGDWPDLRDPRSPRFPAAWCHGAPGIGLGRVGSLPSIDDEQTRQEISAALGVTERDPSSGPDDLCCGTFGRVEILATSGRALRRPALTDRARTLAWQAVSQAGEPGGYALRLPSVGQLVSRGLFQGLSGIGYTLLRMSSPEPFPELLLLR